MKKKCTILIIAIAMSKMAFAGCNAPPADQPKILTMEAVDTSTTAGTRKSTSTLVLVSSGSARTADITITTAGTIGSSYPTWSAGVTASAGDYTASFSGSADKSVTATVKDDSGDCSDSKSISISVIQANETTVPYDSKKLSKLKGIVNLCLTLISENPDPPDFSVSFEHKTKFVDFYNDGSKSGLYTSFDGSAELAFGSAKGEKIFPTSIPAVSFSLGGEIKAFSLKVGAGLTYDQSKSNPWITSSAKITGGASVKAFGEAVLGLNKEDGEDWGLVLVIEGSTSISASGTVKGEGSSIVANGSITAGTLHIKANADVRLGRYLSWEIASIETDFFEGNTFDSNDVTLLTIS